jgi:hypothetical protein
MTHKNPNKFRTKCQKSLVNSQWMKRWFTVFSFFLHKQHQLTRVRPCLLRLLIVRILPKDAVQVKKAVRGGALTFQKIILFKRYEKHFIGPKLTSVQQNIHIYYQIQQTQRIKYSMRQQYMFLTLGLKHKSKRRSNLPNQNM